MIWVGTSWKMNKSRAEARAYVSVLGKAAQSGRWPHIQPFVIPPFTALAEVAEILRDSGVMVGAQNVHWEPSGAWTGEISVVQVADAGAEIVEIGHSERREFFNETDEMVRLKVAATLKQGLTPLLCVGEPGAVFASGESAEYIAAQVEAGLDGLSDDDRAEALIAYEPIWAIGEYGRPAAPEDIMRAFGVLHDRFGTSTKGLLYGGSISLTNAVPTLAVDHIDGLFIGRHAWDIDGFLAILDEVQSWAAQSVGAVTTDGEAGRRRSLGRQ